MSAAMMFSTSDLWVLAGSATGNHDGQVNLMDLVGGDIKHFDSDGRVWRPLQIDKPMLDVPRRNHPIPEVLPS